MAKRRLLLALVGLTVVGLFSASSLAVPAGPRTTGADQGHLGKVNFPNSCSAEAQPLIAKGVALLHSFQYQEARQTPRHGGREPLGAARSGDEAGAEVAVKQLTESVAERENRAQKEGYPPPTEKATDLREAEAWLAFANGKSEDALKELRAAAEHQEKNGGESTVVPAREMLADMLMELKRPSEALGEYRIVLGNAPNRFDGLLGAARAAQASGEASGARSFYAKLTEVCPSGADRPELAEAKAFVAKK